MIVLCWPWESPGGSLCYVMRVYYHIRVLVRGAVWIYLCILFHDFDDLKRISISLRWQRGQHSTAWNAASPAKSKLTIRELQDGQQGLEKDLTEFLGVWTTFTKILICAAVQWERVVTEKKKKMKKIMVKLAVHYTRWQNSCLHKNWGFIHVCKFSGWSSWGGAMLSK